MPKLRIQFVAANAIKGGELRIDEELREIKRGFPRKGTSRPKLDVTPAARIKDVITDLRANRPNIVHFSAHGSPLGEIILLNASGEPESVPRIAFEQLFKTLKGEIRLVVLNACYSEMQAGQIAEFVDCVVGASKTIPDATAVRYSSELYQALSDGVSVKEAHDAALVLAFADRLSKEEVPQLICRKGIDSTQVSFGKGPRTAQTKIQKKISREAARWKMRKLTSHEDDRKRYGIWAESMSITKVSKEDGSSELRFELKGLMVQRDELSGLHFSLESIAGVVGAPVLDADAKNLSIHWENDKLDPPKTADEVIDQARTIHGKFCFDQPIRPGGDPYDFGWSVQILNSDSLTAWEFHNLYPSDKLYHVNGVKLVEPTEYFARLVWFPVRHLHMRVELPTTLKAPCRLRYFELKNRAQIPPNEVFHDKVLWSLPRVDSSWATTDGAWEANIGTQTMESQGFKTEPVASSIAIEAPILGSYYSLDWLLPSLPVTAEFERLIREADVVRSALLEHREQRRAKKSSPNSDQIRELFRKLHEDVRKKYSSGVTAERFGTALMTYDQELHRLVMVEGYVNEDEMPASSWDFWLPFGLGLAGACFRSGRTFKYRRTLDIGNPEKPEHYLLVPNSQHHEFLLSFPVDHPDLSEESPETDLRQRYRQLVGVLTAGSTYRASKLLALCADPLSEATFNELKDLRDSCQEFCDIISRVVLNKSASR